MFANLRPGSVVPWDYVIILSFRALIVQKGQMPQALLTVETSQLGGNRLHDGSLV